MLSWHLIGCAEVSSGRDCQQNMSKPMIFAGHRSRIVSWPAWGNSHTHRAVSTSHVLYADMMDFGEHGPGPLSRSMSHSHHGHPRHKSHLGMLAGVITFVAVFHVVKRCCKRRRKQKPTILSQLSQLSAQSDTMPNPLLQGRHNPASGPMQAAGVIPTSDPDWMANVPWSDWQIDQQDITLCQRPDGRLWELGAGASAKVGQSSLCWTV